MPHGLVDNAAPVIIDGSIMGIFHWSVFLEQAPDPEFFRSQARKYGFDENAYLSAVKKVPVWSQEQLDNYLFFIRGLIEIIAESGLKNSGKLKTGNRSRSLNSGTGQGATFNIFLPRLSA